MSIPPINNDHDSGIPPLLTLPGRLGWTVTVPEIRRHAGEQAEAVLQLTPTFPTSAQASVLREAGIVWNVPALVESLERPGGYYLLDADDGDGERVGIHGPVFVSHPNEASVVWELDLASLRPVFTQEIASIAETGYVRLQFDRHLLESGIRSMLSELAQLAEDGIDLDAIDALGHDIESWSAAGERIGVWSLDPDHGGLSLEKPLSRETLSPLPRRPLWPAGSKVEIGFIPAHDGHELLQIDGEFPRERPWIASWFTRCETLYAFQTWLGFVTRAFMVLEQLGPEVKTNEFVLRHESDRTACHDAGRRLARQMAEAAGPDVQICYIEAPLVSVDHIR